MALGAFERYDGPQTRIGAKCLQAIYAASFTVSLVFQFTRWFKRTNVASQRYARRHSANAKLRTLTYLVKRRFLHLSRYDRDVSVAIAGKNRVRRVISKLEDNSGLIL